MKPRIIALALAASVVLFAFIQTSVAQTKTATPEATAQQATPAITKAYLQKIWDGWSTLNAAGQKQYYAQGAHVFFDDTPLKYNNWDEYQATTTKELAEYKSGSFKLNDDTQIHKSGEIYWVTSTIASDLTQKSGKREQATFRWTAIFEKQKGKWLIVHEHVSVPES
jgi:ketosteroid isomerase-like protein